MTPVVAVDLETGDNGSLQEMVAAVRAFARFRPFEIELESGTRQPFDSLVFANIAQMAKVATLSDDQGRPDDGMCEVITLKHTAKRPILARVRPPSRTRWSPRSPGSPLVRSPAHALGGGTARAVGAPRERIPGGRTNHAQGVAVEVGIRRGGGANRRE